MTDKKLLTVLLLLAFYIFVVNPLNSKLQMKTFELKHLEKAIAKEKFIEKKSKEIEKLYPEALKRIEKNKKLFFNGGVSVSSSMSLLQKIIKNVARSSGLQVVSMNWGVAQDKKEYIVLPISFVVRGTPNRVFSFVKNVLSLDKLIRFSMYSTTKFNNIIALRAVVIGFKIKTAKNGKKR